MTTSSPTKTRPAGKAGAKAARPAVEALAPAEPEAGRQAKSADPKAAGGQLRLRDLVERVTSATGGRARDVKAAVEATLAELGKALDAGEVLNLAGLGKAKVMRVTQTANGPALVVKLRRDEAGLGRKEPGDPLADAGEDR